MLQKHILPSALCGIILVLEYVHVVTILPESGFSELSERI